MDAEGDQVWTDDPVGQGYPTEAVVKLLEEYPWLTGPDQMMLDENNNPSQSGTVRARDRWDWLEMMFGREW